jgi:hypothetical protein
MKPRKPMTPDEYRDTYAALGLTQLGAGRFLGYDIRTSRRWASGDLEIPRHVQMLLRLMLHYGIAPEEASKVAFGEEFHGGDRRRKDDDDTES